MRIGIYTIIGANVPGYGAGEAREMRMRYIVNSAHACSTRSECMSNNLLARCSSDNISNI